MNKILIAIPTKNHEKHIMYYFSKVLDDAQKYNIDIAVYDSSDNDLTQKLVQDRQALGYDNLFYNKYDKDISLELKCKEIFTKTPLCYDYIWLCGDGVVLNLKKNIGLVRREVQKKKDIIVFGNDKRYVDKYREYNNSLEFCKECFGPATWFGAVIIKNGKMGDSFFSMCIEKYHEQAIPGAYFEVFKEGQVNATYFAQDFFDANPYKETSVASHEGRTIYAFARLFYETIWQLPSYYNPIKKNLEKALAYTTGLYKIRHLWALRVNRNLSGKIVTQNLKYLYKSADTNIIIICLIAVCPIKLAEVISLIEDDIW